MSKYRIRYTQQSVDDMDAIFDYIVIENRDAAIKLLQAFEESIRHLADTPYIGAAIPTGDASMIANGYRYLAVSPYIFSIVSLTERFGLVAFCTVGRAGCICCSAYDKEISTMGGTQQGENVLLSP